MNKKIESEFCQCLGSDNVNVYPIILSTGMAGKKELDDALARSNKLFRRCSARDMLLISAICGVVRWGWIWKNNLK